MIPEHISFIFTGGPWKSLHLRHYKRFWNSCCWTDGGRHVPSYNQGQCPELDSQTSTAFLKTFVWPFQMIFSFFFSVTQQWLWSSFCLTAAMPYYKSHPVSTCVNVSIWIATCVVSFLLTYHVFPDEEVLNEEELDKELMWNLQLLSEVSHWIFQLVH